MTAAAHAAPASTDPAPADAGTVPEVPAMRQAATVDAEAMTVPMFAPVVISRPCQAVGERCHGIDGGAHRASTVERGSPDCWLL